MDEDEIRRVLNDAKNAGEYLGVPGDGLYDLLAPEKPLADEIRAFKQKIRCGPDCDSVKGGYAEFGGVCTCAAKINHAILDALADRVEALVTAVGKYQEGWTMAGTPMHAEIDVMLDGKECAICAEVRETVRTALDTAQEEESEPTCNCDAGERPWRFCELHEGQ